MSEDIVVGIDESPSAAAALTWAAARARSSGARLRAIHVLEMSEARELYAVPVVAASIIPDPEWLDPAWTEGTRRVFDAIDPEPGWTLQLGQGHPGQVLVGQSRAAAMLVLGTREHRGFGRLVNGSVSHFCISHALCPVVAVPTASVSEELQGAAAP